MPDFERFAIPGLSADQSYEFTQRSCEVCGKPTAGHGKKWTRPYLCWQHTRRSTKGDYRAPQTSTEDINLEITRQQTSERVRNDRKNGIMYWKDGRPWP